MSKAGRWGRQEGDTPGFRIYCLPFHFATLPYWYGCSKIINTIIQLINFSCLLPQKSKCSSTSTGTLEYLVVLVHTGFEMNKMMGSAVQLTFNICNMISDICRGTIGDIQLFNIMIMFEAIVYFKTNVSTAPSTQPAQCRTVVSEFCLAIMYKKVLERMEDHCCCSMSEPAVEVVTETTCVIHGTQDWDIKKGWSSSPITNLTLPYFNHSKFS